MYRKLLLLLIVLTSLVLSQEISFLKFYNYNENNLTLNTIASNYIVKSSVISDNSIDVVRIFDEKGEVLWSKEFDEQRNTTLRAYRENIITTSDGGFVIFYVNGINNKIVLEKYSSAFEQVWEKEYDETLSMEGLSILERQNGNFVILCDNQTNGIVKLVTISASGDYISNISLDISTTWDDNISFYETSNNFIFNSSRKVYIYDENATLNTYSQFFLRDITVLNNNVYVILNTKIKQIDLNGNEIFQRELDNYTDFTKIHKLDGKLYMFCRKKSDGKDKLLEINPDCSIGYEVPLTKEINDFDIASDGNFAMVGNDEAYFLQKFNSNYDFYFLNFYHPFDNEYSQATGNISLKWYERNLTSLDISYSLDGTEWNLITTVNYPAVEEYTWNYGELVFDSMFIKMESNIDYIYDQNYSPFYVKVYSNEINNYIAANDIKMWMNALGGCSHDPDTDGSGLYWPGGENATLTSVFADGPLIGYKTDDGTPQVHGCTYNYGLEAGVIDEDGNPVHSSHQSAGIYKIRQGWENETDPEVRKNLEENIKNWPGDYGAPYIDNDNDGHYTYGVDNPFIEDSKEVLFAVANAMNEENAAALYGAAPEKIEIAQTVFVRSGLPNTIFKNYRYINKSENTLHDTYFGYWTDPDLGNSNDDYNGCSPSLNTAYCYNGDNYDEDFYASAPPAVAYTQLYGPLTKGEPGDVAHTAYGDKPGYVNVPMTGFAFYINSSDTYQDPEINSPEGSIQMYNYLCSKLWDGSEYINPLTNQPTKFPLDGTPDNHSGWYEGMGWPGGEAPGDRRFMITSGPFDMEPGDTQYVSYAIHLARGGNNINSLTVLFDQVESILTTYGSGLTKVEKTDNDIPESFVLSQNYPNPFNPSTTISFSIPEATNVKLEVFNALGERITTVVNKELQSGNYNVRVNMSAYASGMYIYRLTSNKFTTARKMMYLK